MKVYNIVMYQINMYTLNLQNATHQLYLNKMEGNLITKPPNIKKKKKRFWSPAMEFQDQER